MSNILLLNLSLWLNHRFLIQSTKIFFLNLLLVILGGIHPAAVSKIRSYLMMEHLEKRKLPKDFGQDKMEEKFLEIPLQKDLYNCGSFLLQYVEHIFHGKQ